MKWNDLLRNVDRVTPNHRLGSTNKPKHLDVKYQLGTKVLTFTGEMPSSKGTHGYSIQINFLRIEPTDGLTEEEILQGYMPKPTLAKDDLQVRCSCPSSRFRFDSANRSNRASLGRFGAYHRTTDRAPNNPNDLPGLCYHLIEFMDYLQSQGFVH